MKIFRLVPVVVVVCACAGGGSVIQTPGTAQMDDAVVARLSVPNALTLLTVDGEEVPASRGYDSYEVRLAPGTRRLRFAYEKNWGSAGEYDWVYSDHVVEIVFDVYSGARYTTGYPEPANRNAAMRLADDLRVWIDDPAGRRLTSRQVAAHGSPLTRLLARGSAAAVTDAASGSDSVGQAEAVLAQQDALERLKLWWKLASDSQREQFQVWIKTQ